MNMNMQNPDSSDKSVEQLWLEEIMEKGKTPTEMILQLDHEADETNDIDEAVWLRESAMRIRRMMHS